MQSQGGRVDGREVRDGKVFFLLLLVIVFLLSPMTEPEAQARTERTLWYGVQGKKNGREGGLEDVKGICGV